MQAGIALSKMIAMRNARSGLVAGLLLICSTSVFAQSHEPYIYGELSGGDGTHNIYKVALNTIFMEHQVLSFSFCYAQHRASGIPADYDPNGLFGPSWPQQRVSMFGVSYGYPFFLGTPLVRFIVKGGVAAGTVTTPVNYVYNNPGIWNFGSNYTYSESKAYTMGLVLEPSAEFPLGAGFGFTVGMYANLNPVNSVFGITAGTIFGKVRGRRGRK